MLKRFMVSLFAVALVAAACGDSGTTTEANTAQTAATTAGITEPTTSTQPLFVDVEWGPAGNLLTSQMVAQRLETCVPGLSTIEDDCAQLELAAKDGSQRDNWYGSFFGLETVINRGASAETCLYRPYMILLVGDEAGRDQLIDFDAPNAGITLTREPPTGFPDGINRDTPPEGALFVYSTNPDPYDDVIALRGIGAPVAVHYILVPTPRWKFGPAGAPLPVSAGVLTDAAQPEFGDQGLVLVLDTDASVEINGHDPALGHMTFIEGVVAEFGPTVATKPVVNNDGLMDEGTLDFVYRTTPEGVGSGLVINMSFGTYPCDGVPTEGLNLTMTAIGADGSLVVAAAGNDETSQRFFPAAYAVAPEPEDSWPDHSAYVVSVGANAVEIGPGTSTVSTPADFSNSGTWVEVWAPGVNVVAQYPISVTKYEYASGATGTFSGAAQWDGTSFAAPFVAAAIAAEAGQSGVRAACQTLLGQSVCQ